MTDSASPAIIVRELLQRIRRTPDCVVMSSTGSAKVDPGHHIPADLRVLYQQCGGAHLFRDAPFPWRLCGPADLVPASPRLLTEDIAREVCMEMPDDLTNSCYVIADGGGASTDPHVVIDLHPARKGRCYLVSWETYGVIGEMPVVATSVPELLRWLLDTGGEDLTSAPWKGDAYG
ncbi:SMI1/KNR4 family protein [Plantactinospora sp. ZYX-F-223]|uniref:SMI1/KNR4 family protein n=1 Tax=Plantactinospora sp. ZYX-F-223 TaxID=3144103 RepID=UPI0031FC9358